MLKYNHMNDIKLIIFDINGTLVGDDTWPKFHGALGMTEEEDQLLWQLNNEGVMPNRIWMEVVNGIYQKRGKATKETINKTLLEYTYEPGAKEVVEELRQRYELALISGAPDAMVEQVAKELNIDLFGSNALLLYNDDDTLREMIVLNEEPEGKLIYLQAFCRRLGISPDQVVCVGDGANDVELFRATKHGITFKGSTIENEAWKVVDSLHDLSALL
ncbi:MAG: phosphoserine phosphatase SerB [Candidatus Saccharibacteria bacterium]|nr:phosphoserine phosphatase SerB [Candidatus Saccharibacteria bacterium]